MHAYDRPNSRHGEDAAEQGYSDVGGVAPPSAALHSGSSSVRLVLVAHDPECQGVSDSLISLLKRDASTTHRVALEVDVQVVRDGAEHKEALAALMAQHPHIPPTSIFVLSLIKDGNPEEYKKVKAWTQAFKPPLNSHVITCLSAMQVCEKKNGRHTHKNHTLFLPPRRTRLFLCVTWRRLWW